VIHGLSDLCTIDSLWSSPSSWCYRSYQEWLAIIYHPLGRWEEKKRSTSRPPLVLFLISGGFSSLHHWLVASLFLCFRAKLKQFSFSFEKKKKFPLWGFVFFSPQKKKITVDLFFHVILRVGCWKWVAEWDNKINCLQFGESEDRAQWRWEDCEYSAPPPGPICFLFLVSARSFS